MGVRPLRKEAIIAWPRSGKTFPSATGDVKDCSIPLIITFKQETMLLAGLFTVAVLELHLAGSWMQYN